MKIPGSISSQPRLASQQCFGSQLCKRSFRSLYRPGPPFTGQTPPFSRGTAPVSVRGHVGIGFGISLMISSVSGSFFRMRAHKLPKGLTNQPARLRLRLRQLRDRG